MTTTNTSPKSVLILTVSAEGHITYRKKERKRISAAGKNLINKKGWLPIQTARSI